jgi:hypothetical protein
MSVLARGKAKLGGVEEGMAACGVCAMRGFDLPLGQPSGEIITRARASAEWLAFYKYFYQMPYG